MNAPTTPTDSLELASRFHMPPAMAVAAATAWDEFRGHSFEDQPVEDLNHPMAFELLRSFFIAGFVCGYEAGLGNQLSGSV